MPSRRVSPGDLPLALALLTAGVVAIAFASRYGRAPFDFLPGMEGCLVAGIVGFGLALLAGASFRQALLMMIPILAAQALGVRVHHASPLAAFGVEALLFGAVGAVLAWRARPAVTQQPSEERVEARFLAPRRAVTR